MSFEPFLRLGGADRSHGTAERALIDLNGWRMRVKVSASDTAGQLTLIEACMPAGHSGAAEHIHLGHDEAFFVISGKLRFRVGDSYRTAVAGQTVFASRGLAHGFSNPEAEEARYLAALTPSGYEIYFERLAAMIRRQGSMPDPAQLAALMAEHHTFLALPSSAR